LHGRDWPWSGTRLATHPRASSRPIIRSAQLDQCPAHLDAGTVRLRRDTAAKAQARGSQIAEIMSNRASRS
jgi:hypothetical protein